MTPHKLRFGAEFEAINWRARESRLTQLLASQDRASGEVRACVRLYVGHDGGVVHVYSCDSCVSIVRAKHLMAQHRRRELRASCSHHFFERPNSLPTNEQNGRNVLLHSNKRRNQLTFVQRNSLRPSHGPAEWTNNSFLLKIRWIHPTSTDRIFSSAEDQIGPTSDEWLGEE